MERVLGAEFELGLIAGGGFAGLRHHGRIHEKRAAIHKRAGGGRVAGAPADAVGFALGQANVHGEIAAKGFALVAIPGERTAEKREERLAETGDGAGLGVARDAGARGARQVSFDAGRDQKKRLALDRGQKLGFLFGFAQHALALIIGDVPLQETRGAVLFEDEPHHGAGGGAGAGGKQLGFVGGQHNPDLYQSAGIPAACFVTDEDPRVPRTATARRPANQG